MTNLTIKHVEDIVSVLTPEQKQLLKDTIIYGVWGDCDMELLNENGEIETVCVTGFCTNDAKRGGHFNGRQVAAMFRSIYNKLCPMRMHKLSSIGRYISHHSDWWGDGTGDMMFIRGEYDNVFRQWAKQ